MQKSSSSWKNIISKKKINIASLTSEVLELYIDFLKTISDILNNFKS